MPIVGEGGWSAVPDAIGRGMEFIGDQAGRLRYGVPTSVKEQMAEKGSLPGAPTVPNDERDNRYASGYLFAKQYPNAAPVIQPWIDRVKTSSLPIFGGESPEVQSYAQQGMNRAVVDHGAEAQAKERALTRMAMR